MASSATLSENLFLVSLAVGPSGRQEFELVPGENVIGRKRDASINLPHLDVSREHCIIFSTDGMLALFDQDSRNGTFVNGHKVTARSSVSLFVNDTVGFGVTSSTIESYVDAKTPFLVYRVTKKIPNEVFERLTQEREKTQCVKRRADSSSDVPALKRTKSDSPVPSASFPVTERSKILDPLSPLSTIPESTTRECNPRSAGNNVPTTRSDDMVEFFVIDDSSNESEPSRPSNIESMPFGTASSSSAVETSRVQNSFLTKSVDENSTLKNGSIQNSVLESSTPGPSNSSTNSTLRSNDDTRSFQKSCGKDAGSGSSSKRIDEKTSSAKGLFKTPLMDARGKKEKFESRYVEISSFRADNEDVASKSSDLQTFSLISDDEDSDDGMMSSQIFIKADESQSFLQMPTGMDTSVIDDDEINDLYDSDEDSFFEHLSQTVSQSFVIPEVKEEKRKTSSTKSDKGKKIKGGSESSKKITPSKTSKRSGSKETSSKTSKHVETTSKTIMPNEKTSKSDEKSSTSKRETSKSKTKKDADAMQSEAKTRSQHKDADDVSKLPGTFEDHKKDRDLATGIDDLQVVDIRKSRSVSVLSEDKVIERRGSTELQSDTNKISYGKIKAESKLPQVEVPKKKDVGKKALLIEPQSLSSNNKENRKLKSAGSVEAPQVNNGVVALPKRKTRVTFKEQNMVEVKEFQCLGNMKKLSTMPSHLLKEHPPKIPSLQWNGHLLRGCQQVSDICQWNLKWLQEFQRVDSDPPLLNYQPEPIGNRYKKFDDYYFTMLSLVMHELWSELCRIHLVQTETQRFNIFSGVIEHIEPSHDRKTQFSRCKIVTSSEGAPFLPNFGDIVGVQILAPNKERTHLYDSFGIVTRQYFKERLKPSREANFLMSNLPTNGLDKDKMVVCPVEVIFRASKTHSTVSRDCFVHLRVYKNVINQVKYFLALQKVFTSPLKSVILDPTTSAKGTPEDMKDIKLPSKQFQFPLNALQKEAVTGVTNSVIYEDCSINLIHGPPGTGKSTTITSIILHLLPILRKTNRKGPPPKILLCAPSNTAIDELCLKLLDIRRKLPEEDKFKLTRVGNEKMMHPLVHEISSSALARRGLMSTPDPETLETEIMLLRARIQGFKNGLFSSKAKPNEQQKYHDLIEKCETRLAFYGKTLANIKSGKAPCNPDENRKLLNQEESTIITGAEIIATTLSSCSSRKISDALSDSTQFSCCIVDEATQATEPEILIPLHHDICHLVLVGDPQQLGPTVISKFAKERNFEWSLYHRLMNEWRDYKFTPLYPLREQYRMHAEIVSFPSAKFYNAELKTPDFLQIALPFSTYHVVSHVWPENANEESNDKEARFVVELVQKMCSSEHFPKMTVGIIVPYQSQRALIANIMKDSTPHHSDMSGIVVDLLSLETDMLKFKQRMKFLAESFHRYATEVMRKVMKDELSLSHDAPICSSNGESMQTRPSKKYLMERGLTNLQINGSVMFSSELEKPLRVSTQRSTRMNQMRQIQKLSIVEECSATVTAEDGGSENELSVVSKPQSASKPHSFTLSIKFRGSDHKTGDSKSDRTIVDKVSIPTPQCSLLTKNKNDGKENYGDVANEAHAVDGRNDPGYTLKPEIAQRNYVKECIVVIRRLSNSHWIFQPKVVLDRLTDEEIRNYCFNPKATFCSAVEETGGRVKFRSIPLESVRNTPRLCIEAKKSILKSGQTPSMNKVMLNSSAVQITLDSHQAQDSLYEFESHSKDSGKASGLPIGQHSMKTFPNRLVMKTPTNNNFTKTPTRNVAFKNSPQSTSRNALGQLKVGNSPKVRRLTISKSLVLNHVYRQLLPNCTSTPKSNSESRWKEDVMKNPQRCLKLMVKPKQS